MAIAYAPESIYPLLFEEDGATARSSIARIDAGDFDALYREVRKNLEDVLDQASSRCGMSEPAYEALGRLRELADTAAPESIIKACAEEMLLNKRLISGLAEHLISHIIVGEELRSIAEAARSRVEEGFETVAPIYIGLVNSLKAAGIVENNVRDMSKSQFIEILAILKKTSGDEQKRVISEVSEGRVVVPAIFKEGFEDGVAPGEQANASGVAPAKEEVSPSLVSDDADDECAIADAATKNTVVHDPKGLWDRLDLEPIGYRIEEAEPSTDADKEAMTIKLPETTALTEWASPRSTEYMYATVCMNTHSKSIFDEFLSLHTERTGRLISEMEERILLMLMVDLWEFPGAPIAGQEGWYDGIVLPPKTGSSKVRRVVSIDRSDKALTMAYRPKEGIGSH
ncbi:MAG: hypothetical protein ACK4ZW_03105 [Blastomonas sp.]